MLSLLRQTMQIRLANTDQFKFTRPKFSFGQKVMTEEGQIGYIVGLDFYPESSMWSYGVYIVNHHNELVEELWFEAQQLRSLEEFNPSIKQASHQFNLISHHKFPATS
jgi:hypothetical protein